MMMNRFLLALMVVVTTVINAQSIRSSYFLTTLDNSNYLGNNSQQIVFESIPQAIELTSTNDGKTVMIALGDYWLKVDTTEADSVVLSSNQPKVNELTGQWIIETMASTFGVVYTIKSAISDTTYYLNCVNHQGLNVVPYLAPSAMGSYWLLEENSGLMSRNYLLHTGDFDFPPNNLKPIATPDSILFFKDGVFSIANKNDVVIDWNWQLEKDPDTNQTSYEISITNLKNEKYYMVPKQGSSGDCGLKISPIPFYAPGPVSHPIETGWLPGLIDLNPEKEIGLYSAYHKFNCPNCPYVSALKVVGKGFSCSTSNASKVVPIAVSQFNLTSYEQYYVSDASQQFYTGSLSRIAQANKLKTLRPIQKPILQEFTYRSIGSNKYYIYGNQDSLIIAKRNRYFPTINDDYLHLKEDTTPISGSSTNDTYLYLVNNDSLRLYSLFGLNNPRKGLLSIRDLGNFQLSPPVYNPVSHQVFGLAENGYVYGFGQGLASNLVTFDYGKSISGPHTELFVVPENDTLTHLYFLNGADSLVRLVAGTNSIEKNGAAVAVSNDELRWLRYQTKLLNHEASAPFQTLVPIKNGYAAGGPIGLDSSYVLFFTRDSILGTSKVSLYAGPNAAFPTFTSLDSIGPVNYNGTTLSTVSWIVQDADSNNLWTVGYPSIFYEANTHSFTIETLAGATPFKSKLNAYTYSIPLNPIAFQNSSLFNLQWQQGGSVKQLKEGSPLNLWYQYDWMKNAQPFPQ